MRFRHLMIAGLLASAIPAVVVAAKPLYGSWGYDASAMNSAVKPGDDFFAYVNGSWDKRTEIAPDRTFAGIDSVLNDQIERDVRTIVEDMAKDPSANGRLGQQIGDLYASWMDENTVEKLGTQPLQPYLERIAAVKTRGDLVDLFAEPGFDSPVGIQIYPDLKNPTRYAAYASQDGLGMPNRDYYLLKGDKYDSARKA
jgi:putative endopeptidase